MTLLAGFKAMLLARTGRDGHLRCAPQWPTALSSGQSALSDRWRIPR